jgi:hypothetical protein
MATLLGQAWLKDSSIATASDDELFDRIILGRKPFDANLLKETGMLVSAFGLLGLRAPLTDLDAVAPLSRDRSMADLRAALDELIQRGVVQQHGRLVNLQPKPLAMALAERQWRRWNEADWDHILAGALPAHLRTGAARQLALLNDRPIAVEVARHACRLNGPFASLAAFEDEAVSEVLSLLAEIDADAVLSLLERVFKPLSRDEFKAIGGQLRRHLVWALEKIAFLESTFERAAILLLDLGAAENERWGNNATGQFKRLFPVFLGNTAAGPEARVRLLDELIQENDPLRMPLVIDALLSGATTQSHHRIVGAEIHGSRPALKEWRPKLWKDVWDYVLACMDRLATLALRHDALGQQARSGMAHDFRVLVTAGLIDHVEGWINSITAVHRYWPEVLNALGDVLQYDSDALEPATVPRVRNLIATLNPTDFADRVRFLVTEMPWDYPVDEKLDFAEQQKRQLQAVEDLARDLLQHPDVLAKLIPQMSLGQQRMSLPFGGALARFADKPDTWAPVIQSALENTPEPNRNFGLLAGYYSDLATRNAGAVGEFKRQAAGSPVFGPALPILCATMGITESDVQLVCGAIRSGIIDPRLVSYWTMGGVLAKLPHAAVVPLFNLMLNMDRDAYSVALDLMGMYVHGTREKLEGLRPELVTAAKNCGKRPKRYGSQMDAHHFEQMMGWLLSKGREDADARTVALALANQAADDPDGNAHELIKPLLPAMFSKFASLVWPVFGQAIVSDRTRAWRIEHVLGESFSFGGTKNPPILHVPGDILFAWCHANPEVGPAFVAATVPVLTTERSDAPTRAFHPIVKRLLDEFGDRPDVLKKLVQNMHTFGWTGSRTTYYALYDEPLRSLENHPIGAVRRWAKTMLFHMNAEIQSAKSEDDEQQAHWNA